jgi:ATP-dependent protease ClpP protease subunit
MSKMMLIFFLFLNSHGGEVLLVIALYDTTDFLDSNMFTLAIGLITSSTSLILVGGTIRMAFPHVRILIHQSSNKNICHYEIEFITCFSLV